MNQPPPFPSRQEVESRLIDLIEGRCTREEASDWAAQWVLADQRYGLDLVISDWGVWDALVALMGADLRTIDRPYLHDEVDYRAWLAELRTAFKYRRP